MCDTPTRISIWTGSSWFAKRILIENSKSRLERFLVMTSPRNKPTHSHSCCCRPCQLDLQHAKVNFATNKLDSLLHIYLRVEYKLSNCSNLKLPGWQNATNFCHCTHDKLPLSVGRRLAKVIRKHHGPTDWSWWTVGTLGSRRGCQSGHHGCHGPILCCCDWIWPNLAKIIN
jgi:hypothetical protein